MGGKFIKDKVVYRKLSYVIVGILFEVYNDMGYGYQEKYYEKAIAKRLDEEKIKYKRQVYYPVTFKDKKIGRYYLDFIVDDKIVIELKRGNYFSKNNIEQIKGYLAATNMRLAILAHFTSNGVKIFRALNPNNIIKK